MIGMGDPEINDRGVDGFLYDGALATLKTQPPDDAIWKHARGKGPYTVIVMGIVRDCSCSSPGCSGEGREQIELLVGYESMAAFMGQFEAWVDTQPVHVRDQSRAITRDIKRKTAEHLADWADGK